MIFGLQSKAFMIVGAICAVLLLGMCFLFNRLMDAKSEIGFMESEVNYTLQVNEKNIERINRFRDDKKRQEQRYLKLMGELASLTSSYDREREKTKQLEIEHEDYRKWRDTVSNPVANNRVREAVSTARNRIHRMLGASPVHDADTAPGAAN